MLVVGDQEFSNAHGKSPVAAHKGAWRRRHRGRCMHKCLASISRTFGIRVIATSRCSIAATKQALCKHASANDYERLIRMAVPWCK